MKKEKEISKEQFELTDISMVLPKICSSCKHELPEVLDRRLCPTCERRTG